MKFYPKKLSSAKDLQREKKLLLKRRRHYERDVFANLPSALGGSGANGKDGISALTDLLSGSNPIAGAIVKRLARRLAERKEGQPKRPTAAPKEETGKNRLRSVAWEFIGGYLKWKAIQYSIKAIRRLIKMQQEKKSE